MAKQLNVNLAFTADTSQAKSQLNDLQMSLSKLTQSAATNTGELGLNKELTKSISKVTQLQALLEKSKNSTGGLDLNKFTTGLQQSKTSINDYAKALSSLGPQGEQAFAKFARSVSTAQVPLKQANGLLTQFGTTLKNTARWQLSSSVLHGFMGAVSTAYGYA